MTSLSRRCHRMLFIDCSIIREALAEFFATVVLILIGVGANLQAGLSHGSAGSMLSINFSWGLGVTFAVYVAGGVSGGHMNPAISLAFCLLGKLHPAKVPVYWLSQYAGAIFGSALAFAVYYDAIQAFDGGIRAVYDTNTSTGQFFATYPQDYLSTQGGVVDQIVGTALLAFLVVAVTDTHNSRIDTGLAPFVIGFIVTAIGMTYGYNCGYAINPARDMGPRIFTAMAGWGKGVFSYRNYNWFWVPFVCPHIGAVIGAFSYQLAIGLHWPEVNPHDGIDNEPTTTLVVPEVNGKCHRF